MKEKRKCSVEGCNEKHDAKGYCKLHYNRFVRGCKNMSSNLIKKRGGTFHSRGYVYVYNPEYHRANKNGYVSEHILNWEKAYQRKIPKGYLVHHLNGIKDDNRPENLIIMRKGEHTNQTEPYKKRIRELELEIAQLKQLNLFGS